MSAEATELADQKRATADRLPVRPAGPLGRWIGSLRNQLGPEARHAFRAILDQGVVSGLSFATTVVVAASCGSHGLGIAHLALTLIWFTLNVQCELVVAPFMVYRNKRTHVDLEAYRGSVLMHQVLLIVVALVALSSLLVVLLAGFGPVQLVPTLCVLLGAAPLYLLHGFLRHFSFASLQFHVALVMDIVVAVLQLGALLLLAYLDLLTVPRVFAVMGGACAAACVGWFVLRPAPYRVIIHQLWPHWRENWNFGRWALSSHVVGCATAYILPWMVIMLHDESATGTLAACTKISALAGTFVLGVAHFVTPKAVAAYAQRGLKGLYVVLGAGMGLFTVSVTAYSLLVMALGDKLMVGLFGAEFANTGLIATLLSFAVLVNSVAIMAGNGLWAIDRPQANLFGDAATLVATLLVAIWLVGPLSALGAAIATLVGSAVGAVVRGATFWLLVREVRNGRPCPC